MFWVKKNMNMAASIQPWLPHILQEESTQKYYIEHEGYKSNHMAHGIVALHNLGASKSRIQQFIDWYSQYMEPPDHPNHRGENPNDSPANEVQLQENLGKRRSFYEIRNCFEYKLKHSDSLTTFIQTEFPKLSDGLSSAAFHGLIQLGYGYYAQCGKVVCEGLAYIHHSYKPLTFDVSSDENNIANFGRGDANILDVVNKVREDSTLRKEMLTGALENQKICSDKSNFTNRLAVLMENGDKLLQYINKIEIPEIKSGEGTVVKVSEWLIHQAVAVFSLSERPNDFFLLHGVTGCWALRQIIPVLKPSDALEALRAFACSLLATYAVQDSPELVTTEGTKCNTFNEDTWKEIIGRTLSSDFNEHIFKLVQVCYEEWCKNKLHGQADIYVKAANSCLENDLAFLTYDKMGELSKLEN